MQAGTVAIILNFAMRFWIAFAALPALAQAYPTAAAYHYVYFGVAGPGIHADTWAGHAFVVFTSKPKVLLGGQAYQYNIKMPDPKLLLTTEEGQSYVQHYINEDRQVTLYLLRLSQAEVARLQLRLERDRTSQFDLGAIGMNNNCASRMVEAVNDVVSSERQIASSIWSGNLNFIPINLVIDLKTHPLINPEGTYLLSSRRVGQIKMNLKIKAELDSLTLACTWPVQKSAILGPMLFNERTRYTHSFFDYFLKQLAECNSPSAAEIKNALLDLLSSDLTYYSNFSEQRASAFQTQIEEHYVEQ